MNRTEATSLLKKITQLCEGFGAEGIMLMPPNADDVLSHGYQLHIKGDLTDTTLVCIKPLIEEKGLAVVHEPEKQLIVIYRPMKTEDQLVRS